MFVLLFIHVCDFDHLISLFCFCFIHSCFFVSFFTFNVSKNPDVVNDFEDNPNLASKEVVGIVFSRTK